MPSFETLIESHELASILDQHATVVFDVRFSLLEPQAGRQAYQESHLPGAYYLDLDHDLAGPVGPSTGRHPLPDATTLAQRLGQCGVTSSSQVVVYDDAAGAFAARLWWLCKWLGHDKVAVLNGGFAKWKTENKTVATDIPPSTFGDFTPRLRDDMVATVEDVTQRLSEKKIVLLDARSPERFRGEVEPIDKIAGHIRGASNLPMVGNLDEHKCFLPIEALRERHPTSEAVVHMCGSGITACHNILASCVAGNEPPRLFVGSWSQWITDPTREQAVGK